MEGTTITQDAVVGKVLLYVGLYSTRGRAVQKEGSARMVVWHRG